MKSPPLRAIRVRCQRPGCEKPWTLAIGHLEEIGRRAGTVRVLPEGMVSGAMLVIHGWGYGVDLDGVLYAFCPVDVAAIRVSPEPCG